MNNLPKNNFDVILIDPPWKFLTFSNKGITKKGAEGQYKCMTLDQIKQLPVYDLGKKDCFCFMWGTNPLLPECVETLKAWGFKYKTKLTWIKTTKHNKDAFGTGYLLRCADEYILIGTKGKPRGQSRSVRSFFRGLVREHSRKPEEIYPIINKLVGENVNKVELFAREERDGWTCWGDEVTLFNKLKEGY